MKTIKEFMEQASKDYYNGEPTISNEEYDALEVIYGQLIGGTGDIKHMFRMYSLKKHYAKDGDLPLNKRLCVETLKLDGAACAVTYINGHLQHALTRGNGVKGRDITLKVLTLGLPEYLNDCPPVLQVTGEIVASKGVENSRNYASGALGQKDMAVWEQRKTDGNIRFIAYNAQAVQNRWGFPDNSNYLEDMEKLADYGFDTITSGFVLTRGTDSQGQVVTTFDPWDNVYPTDGIVYRLRDTKSFNDSGFTDKFPKGAIAFKEEQESVVTTILDIEWNCGKSGKVAPIALLETVVIGEANISRATLNNIAYIEALDLEIGCQVEVIRSGEIIPKIIGRVYV